ncbi:inositol 2-dehydrogenase [Rhizobium etli]|uniref:Myo-inositol 2-dehydrogenase/D-chiro-inositol 1-dehydrogenase n=1 Tax=Rhizobium etli TaxID=29449 RepID=A0A7W6VBP9_RHIET|nr:inositol 2-dehydrogenase [Rhizobium etli]MBB4481251.1 myo-inositol 2-dehydrogenase/D-chiro-inositol 1-dehydrogenase [Rhizobium etli]MBB4537136.1 myo-inositol 2-dehydrogenase/D-chiro-inositol 1-dehydrogenase [Rhizobium etli]
MIRFGVIGAGRIGKVHATTIAANPNAKLAYVADAFKASAEELAARTGAEVAEAEDVINSSNVDAILIATPTPSHADLIEAAARAGKAILCEKPVSLSVDRINACLEIVEKNRSTLMIGFNRRFDPNFASLEVRLRRGDIGAIEIVTITSRDPAPPPADYVKSSGGLFRDMMIHDFDMARFLMGEEFVVVNALGSSLVDKAIGAEGDVDTAAVQMQTASGRIAVITNSRRATYGYDQRIEVHGAAGMLAAKNIAATSVELSNANGISGDPVQHFFLERYAQAYANEINTFIEAIDSGNPSPRPGGLDGLQAQKLAEAATVSWQTGRPVAVN